MSKEIEDTLEKLDVFCKQADQYQLNAGYPIDVPTKEIIRNVLTTFESSIKERILSKAQTMTTQEGEECDAVDVYWIHNNNV